MALSHAAPGERINLGSRALEAGEARAAALVKTDRFEAVQLLMKKGSDIPAHAVDGFITLQCLEGQIALVTDRGTTELQAGDWIYLDRGDRHGLTALQDSRLLLTILFDPA